ncbi:MAG TPA: tRNA (cytidine(34)-2'-O)-methyltransferase [Xanthomonadales bacterium]|nr:tRNA (cytidine(34)-2'-O)-methyltransferase [Xanthomonadales bacterium]
MFHIILFQPEIPPNTGNIIRLCANSGAHLHLVEPLGFELDDAKVRRAGLDYHELACVSRYASWLDLRARNYEMRLWAFSSRGCKGYDQASFEPGDGLVFGSETRGLPAHMLAGLDPSHMLRVPMKACSRSLNLSNTVALVLYEALRQNGFNGLR